MPGIFISYRRADSDDTVGRMYDHLALRFDRAHIFRDVDSIRPGESFPRALARAVNECSVGLIVIGRNWLSASDQQGKRRIDDAGDFVRLEVEALLGRGIPVIPCLVENGAMPSPDALPIAINGLSTLQAVPVRPDPDFRADMDRLVKSLLVSVPSLARVATPRSTAGSPAAVPVRSAGIVSAALAGLSLWVALEIGHYRDPLLFYAFAIVVPLGVAGAYIGRIMLARRRKGISAE